MATTTDTPSDLPRRLSGVLPKGHQFNIFHLSTPPTKCPPLYAPPPNERPDRTYCEKHFLTVSVNDDQTQPDAKGPRRVLVLGIEVYIYTTAYSTTIFVSKADSTGYLHLLNLPRGTPSPIREICAAFLRFLTEKRRREGVQLIVSLFARAQAQYLFPGSVDNKDKHVLDDRGLVKWWCRVLDPLLLAEDGVRGYIVVPGLDAYETRAYVPRGDAASGRWTQDHPLERISHYAREFDWVPPRCLIPQFPDDPKSRFRDELDEEAARSGVFRDTGGWKSVKTLDMFWEMMAYRQECSSGRMTGFIWLVFNDEEAAEKSQPGSHANAVLETPRANRTINIAPTTTPRKLFAKETENKVLDEDAKKKKSRLELQKKKLKSAKKRKLRGPIIPRVPKIKKAQRNYLVERVPPSSAYYSWTPAGRGERIYSEDNYKRIIELLLHSEFATLDKAAASTRRWLGEASMGASWGYSVTGTREPSSQEEEVPVKRKREESVSASTPEGKPQGVNVLSAGLVRKKPKVDGEQQTGEKAVNVLGSNLVRKKREV